MADVLTLKDIFNLKIELKERARRAEGGPVRPEDYSSYVRQLDAVDACLEQEQHATARKALKDLTKTLSMQARALTAATDDYLAQDAAKYMGSLGRRLADLDGAISQQEQDYARAHAAEDSALLLKVATNDGGDELGTHRLARLVVAAATHIARQDKEISELRDRIAAMEKTLTGPDAPLDKPRLQKPRGV